MSEQDSPWKEALEHYLPSFLALYFPAVHAAIDWTRNYEWLNTELHHVVRDVLQLFRIIDSMMDLPEALEQLFKREAEQIEQEIHMPYVTSVERLAKQEGRIEGQTEERVRC